MKLALSTNWCNRKFERGEEIVDKALELGFSALELGYNTTSAQVEGIRRRLDEMPVGSVHAFCPVPISAPQGYPELYSLASFSRPDRDLARAFVVKNLEFAASVGADVLVLHAGRVAFSSLWRVISTASLKSRFKAAKNDVAAPAYARLLKKALAIRRRNGRKMLDIFKAEMEGLSPVLDSLGVTLALENLPYLEGFPDESETEELLKGLSGARVKGWLDSGHDRVRRMHGWTDAPAVPDPALFAGMHVNDVVDFTDDHFAPGFGKVDFAALADFAAKVPHVVFEPNDGVTEEELKAGVENYEKQVRA
jgi:sugar phosphate isomerase/epimerase